MLTDITYFFYGKNRTKAYLSVIKDAYTKEILSYELSGNLQVDFVLKTIKKLLRKHRNELHTDVLIHSDQGVHFTSYSYIELLKKADIRRSMSRRGNCWDNAPQESFFDHMKDEIGSRVKACELYIDLVKIIDKYMDYYNNYRYQWNLAKLSSSEYYKYCMTGEYPNDYKE